MSDKPTLPVVTGPVIDHDPVSDLGGPRPRKRSGLKDNSTFSAQVLGGGEKRGLKGGPETLERAKTTYLKSEYSGPNDRRPQAGIIKKTEI